jgi:predicted O-methyltransferase YrrM
MSHITPRPVADYLGALHRLPHPVLERIATDGHAMHLPIVDAATGALLHALVHATGARRVLEIGTAIGYSTLWMATALPAGGALISLERDATRAEAARRFAADAGVDDRVNVMVGEAARVLHKIAGPFDLIFQDGDKAQYLPMLDRLVALLGPRGILVTDNILWDGEVVPGYVATPSRRPEDTAAIAEYSRALAADPRLFTTFLPVGDGVAVSTRLPEEGRPHDE